MHIVVVGCGRVGSGLATRLSEEGHSVVIIDKNRDAFRRLSSFSGTTLLGSGFDRDILFQADARRADALAAVTSGDNTNILCARIARDNYRIKNVVARIYDPQRADIYKKLGIPTVATSTWTVNQVMRWLVPRDDSVEWTDGGGTLHLVERILPDHLAGQPLGALNISDRVRVVGLIRGSQGRVDLDGLFAQEDDVLEFLCTEAGLVDLAAALEAAP
ncbi:MAG TPA: TrkA family potassium uptake protein [Acidimicrobiales bacterium]|nr:TrkA family potassium uptake protein [Acidimicrobiales bacterium]